MKECEDSQGEKDNITGVVSPRDNFPVGNGPDYFKQGQALIYVIGIN